MQKWKRASLITFSLIALFVIYLYQRFNYFNFFATQINIHLSENSSFIFIFNKTFRLLLNDAACFILILAIFQQKKFLRVAAIVFLFEFLFLLPIYFALKLSLEGDSEISSPLLSQLHRLIINPTLMLLLIGGFFYQSYILKKRQ
jgi:exosortase F-associated protein